MRKCDSWLEKEGGREEVGIILDSDSSQVITQQQQHPVYRLSIAVAVAVAMAVLVVMAMLQ